jgi:hypothetical protein
MPERIYLEQKMLDYYVNVIIYHQLIKQMHNVKLLVLRILTVWIKLILLEKKIFFSATPYAKDEPIFLDSTGCNKMIMIVTDGATETAFNVYQNRNWTPNNVSTCHPIEVTKNKKRFSLFY